MPIWKWIRFEDIKSQIAFWIKSLCHHRPKCYKLWEIPLNTKLSPSVFNVWGPHSHGVSWRGKIPNATRFQPQLKGANLKCGQEARAMAIIRTGGRIIAINTHTTPKPGHKSLVRLMNHISVGHNKASERARARVYAIINPPYAASD